MAHNQGGMSISRVLVTQQGGRIWLKGRGGAGVTASFVLPAMEGEANGSQG